MAAVIVITIASDMEKYTNGHIYETDPSIYIKFVAKWKSLQFLFSGMTGNVCERFPLSA